MSGKAINKINVVLDEKNLCRNWLAEQLDKNEATISQWVSKDVQSFLNTLLKIAKFLNDTPIKL